MKIPVLMTVDENFILQEKVAIWSVCSNFRTNNELDITILCSPNLEKSHRDSIIELESIWKNLHIRFYDVDQKDFYNAKKSFHIAIASYYRLIAGEVIKEDRCIYLDGDIIVECDLMDLFLENDQNMVVSGAPDMNVIANPNLAYQYKNDCNIIDFSDYINCGVLLMNLKRIRNEGFQEIFLKEANEGHNIWLDQDVINRVCHGKIHRLDWKYNQIALYSEEDYEAIYKKSDRKKGIIHWAGGNKPWNNQMAPYADKWWKIAKEALRTDEYNLMMNQCEKKLDEWSFNIINNCTSNETIVICGYSIHGIRFLRMLRKKGVESKIVFIDNNINKRNMHLSEQTILSFEESLTKYSQAIYVIAIQNGWLEVMTQLRNAGIRKDKIYRYHAYNLGDFLGFDRNIIYNTMDEASMI